MLRSLTEADHWGSGRVSRIRKEERRRVSVVGLWWGKLDCARRVLLSVRNQLWLGMVAAAIGLCAWDWASSHLIVHQSYSAKMMSHR